MDIHWLLHCTSQLFLDLCDQGVNACGTVRSNRKYYPKDLVVKVTEVERRYYDYRSSGPLLACFWRDEDNSLSEYHSCR